MVNAKAILATAQVARGGGGPGVIPFVYVEFSELSPYCDLEIH